MWRISRLNLMRDIGSWVLLCKTRHWEQGVGRQSVKWCQRKPEVTDMHLQSLRVKTADGFFLFSRTNSREGSKPRNFTDPGCWQGLLLRFGQCESEQAPSFLWTLLAFYISWREGRFQSSTWWHRPVVPCWRLTCPWVWEFRTSLGNMVKSHQKTERYF